MEAGDDEIRGAAHLASAPTGACLTAEELDAYFSNRVPEVRADEIRSHLVSCASCLELARDFRTFVDAAREGAPSAPRSRLLAFTRRPLVPLATAAAAVLGVWLLWKSLPTTPRPETVRGPGRQVVELVAPRGELSARPTVLEWQPAPFAEHYEVEIRDVALKVVWRASDVRQTSIALPPEVTSALEPGVEYGWRVTAVAPGGRRTTSPIQTFVVTK